jgi:hypothetical protein
MHVVKWALECCADCVIFSGDCLFSQLGIRDWWRCWSAGEEIGREERLNSVRPPAARCVWSRWTQHLLPLWLVTQFSFSEVALTHGQVGRRQCLAAGEETPESRLDPIKGGTFTGSVSGSGQGIRDRDYKNPSQQPDPSLTQSSLPLISCLTLKLFWCLIF